MFFDEDMANMPASDATTSDDTNTGAEEMPAAEETHTEEAPATEGSEM